MKASGEKSIITVLLVFLSLALVALFLAQSTVDLRREKRENTYVQTAKFAAAEFKIPLPLVLAVIRTESDFRPNAVSEAGACGLMQLLPETFSFLQEDVFEEDLPDSAIFDPTVNIRYGTYYLSYLFEKFGNWFTALAAYNAGEGRVGAWLKDKELAPDGHLVHIPFSETAQYVQSALEHYGTYREKYP
ncbi:MAG: transglycosylase SLT domain-containing protein [Clostridia bacterium]|nr:transglycosylase SLT domain-containing protein [Clostridia bacterium]MBQ8717425.1 transglycosylase SLT domain-containing protein [Clostridia bacterium]